MSNVIELSEINSRTGFSFDGVLRGDRLCGDVGNAGDFNGDGVDDLVLRGSNLPDLPGRGGVLFGSRNGTIGTILEGNGLLINGEQVDDLLGFAVSGAGDFNGDGISDVIIGSPLKNTAEIASGESLIVFGRADNFDDLFDGQIFSISVADLDGNNGIRIPGILSNEQSGFSVDRLGDFNNDGIDDVIIGAPFANNSTGRAYVVFGQSSPFSSTFDLNTLNGANGFIIDGTAPGESLGSGVSYAGDLNNDGINDLIVNNFLFGNTGFPFTEVGERVYVVFGRDSGFEPSMNLADLNGENGFFVNVESVLGLLSSSIRSVGIGDVNSDETDDFIINLPRSRTEFAETYILFGRSSLYPRELLLSSISDNEGVAISGALRLETGLTTGSAVAAGGDLNGDGIPDLLIGDPGVGALPPNVDSARGQSYAVFGRTDFNATLSLASLAEEEGLIINGAFLGDRSGEALAAADLNGDGLDDVIVGAPDAIVRTSKRGEIFDLPEGICYVIFSNVAPELVNNQLSIREGNTVAITPNELSATDINDDEMELTFFISNTDHGFFQRSNNTGIPIRTFNQRDIINNDIVFSHDGTEIPPTYSISVSDGRDNTTAVPAMIDFSRRSSSTTNTAAIIGGTVGGIAGVGLILGVAGAFWYRSYKKKKRYLPDTQKAMRKVSQSSTTELELGNTERTLTESLLSNQW